MLRLLISDARMRRVSGRSAQDRVRERYLWPAVAQQTAAVYQQLMQSGKVRRVAPSPVQSSDGAETAA
jgi:hypothetical protein